MSEKTTYVIKDINRDIWVRFRGKAMLNGLPQPFNNKIRGRKD